VGLEALLGVLREEAANEALALREGAAREAERVVAEARASAEATRGAALAREAEARGVRLRAERDAARTERERRLTVEARRRLEGLRAAAIAPLMGAMTGPWVERLTLAMLREVGPAAATVTVDPGFGPFARAAIQAVGGEGRVEVIEASMPRGGVELVTGSLRLEATAASTLERVWDRAEPEIAKILLGGVDGAP
jgi:vacuolar-type H+-ATPase subunit E/Vma4